MPVSARFAGVVALMAIGFAGTGYLAVAQISTPQRAEIIVAEPVDIDRMLSFLPDEIAVTYAGEKHDQASGRTTLKDLRITFGENDAQGFAIDELVVAGFATDALEARINGTNFEERVRLVDHLEARGVSLFGMEQFYGSVTDAYLGAVEDLAEGATGDDIPDIEQSFDHVGFAIERIVIDDFELLPFLLPKTETQNTDNQDVDAEAFAALRAFAAYSRAMGARKMSMEGVSMDFEMTQDGQKLGMDMHLPLAVIQGWRGGDYDSSLTANMTFNMAVPNDDVDSDLPVDMIEMSGAVEEYLVENVRLDNALGWLARGEMPPTTETDLLGLGVWKVKNQTFSFFGKPFYSIESSVTDMSQFHWLVPTRISHETQNLVFDMGSFFDTMSELSPDIQDDPDLQIMRKAMTVLKKYDLAAYSTDVGLQWLWNPEVGPASLSMETGLDGYGTMSFDISGLLGGFDDWVATVETSADEAAFEGFATENFAFDNASFKMDDRGGNQRVFDLIVELAEVLGGESDDWSAISGYDAKELKALVTNGIQTAGQMAASDVPALRIHAESLAAYLTKGGLFEIALNPRKPVRPEVLSRLADLSGLREVWTFLEQIGLEITYTPS